MRASRQLQWLQQGPQELFMTLAVLLYTARAAHTMTAFGTGVPAIQVVGRGSSKICEKFWEAL